MEVPNQVSVVDVSARDGLQSLPTVYSARVKVEMIELVAAAGVRRLEVGSFVRPDVVPQLADTEAVLGLLERRPGYVYRALVPNRHGAERAVAAGVDEMVALITASETYNLRNQNMTIDESLAAIEGIVEIATQNGISVVAAVGLAMFCPYEGPIPVARTTELVERLTILGVEEAYVASSAGVDGPRQVHRLCSEVRERCPGLRLGVHLHNANGMGLANALAALNAGVTVLEAAVCGIGGGTNMPADAPLPGNLATEDLVQMLDELNVKTDVSVDGILAAAREVKDLLGLRSVDSYALRGGTRPNLSALARTAARPDLDA